MKRGGRLVAVLAAILLLSAGAFAQEKNLGDLLKETGLKYSALEGQADSWRVPFDAKEGATMDVFVTYNDDKRQFALIFATVVDREDNYSYGREVLVEAMKLNNDFPGVKFVLDEKHGDIDCQTEVYMTTITTESLAMYVNLVASMADENAAKLQQLAGGGKEGEGGAGQAPALAVPTSAATPADPITWLTSYDEALRVAAAANKQIIVDFYGLNCGACERMDKVTFADPQVQARAGTFVFVKVDVAQREDLMKQFGVVYLPTIVLLSPQGTEVRRQAGWTDAAGMLALMGK